MAYKFSTEGGYGIGGSVFHYDALHPDRVDIPDAELLFSGGEHAMAYKFSTEGGYGIGGSVFHYDALHPDRVDIPDAELLFRGHFARSGPDLILTGQDGQRHIVPGYFATEKHPDLVAPNGAHLSADVVDLLAGSPIPGRYAQAHTALPPEAIGKVEKVVGNVTLLHNGVSEPLHVGDAVFKSDVVQTSANSSAGIAFPDGTALDLVADTRMALNEYSFDAAGTTNGALFSLVEGTFAFVAGQVAHSGEGMKINTPVATMGIRGTVGLFRSEPTVINANLGHVWSVFLHEDLDGSHHLGRIALIDQDPTSPTFGQVIYLLDSSDYVAHLEPRGPGLPPLVRLEPITDSKISRDRHFYDDLTQILNAYNNANDQPNGATGSGDNPNQLFTPPQNFEENGGGLPLLINLNRGGGSDSGPTLNVEVPVQPAGISPQSSSQSTSDIFIWTAASGGPFGTGPDWNLGSVPGSTASVDIFEVNGAPVTVTIDAPEIINNLTIGPGVTLSIIAPGSLTVLTNLVDSGFIRVGSPGGWDPSLSLTGPISINSGGRIEANTAANIDFHDVQIISAGTIEAVNGGIVFLSDGTTFDGGTLATDSISIVEIQSGPGGSGATLGDVALGGNLQVDPNAALTLQSTVNSQATIHVAANAFLFLDAAAVLNGGTVALAGGTINGSGDLAPTDLTGYGTVNLPFNSADTVRADGGTLEFTNVVDSSAATAFEIGSAPNSVLKFDSAVGAATTSPTITFEGGDDGHGVVDLTKISLSDFHGVIANFDEGESIDVADATGVALEANGTTLDVYDGSKLLGTLTFSVSYAGDIFSVSNNVITVDDLVATFDAATVPGQSAQGAALTVTGVADNHTDVSESVTYAWRIYDTETNSWTTVGTGSSYTPSESDEDHQLQLVVTYANDPSGSQSTTYNFGTVQEIAGDDTVVSIGGLSDGNAVEGTPVTATISDGGLAVSGATYQWQLNGKDIVGATSATFTPTEINEGQALTIHVTFTDAAGNNETGSGTAGIVQDAAPEGPVLGGATSATVGEGAIILLGVTDGRVDSDDSLGVITITGLPHDLTDVSGGSYDSDDGTWTGTAAQFNALSFAAGEDGTFHLTISATTTGTEAATATESYTLTVFENAEDEWNNSSGGAWSTAWNWTVEDGGQRAVPTSGYDAVIDQNGTYTVTTSGTVTANSLTIGDANATLSGSGTLSIPNVGNDGTIVALTGFVFDVTGNITGNGTLGIGNRATLELGGTSTNAVTFEGEQGTLQIDSHGTSSAFSVIGNPSGLPAGDTIYLPNISFNLASDNYDAATGVLAVGDGNGHTVAIDIIGGVGQNTFSFNQSGTGTDIYDPPVTETSSASSVVPTATAVGVNGTMTFPDADPSGTQRASVASEGSNCVGAFSLGPLTEQLGTSSADFRFSLASDQIKLASDQTVTQSYDVTFTNPQLSDTNLSQTISVSIGGPGSDNFVFKPGTGADTIVNFNPQTDAIELDHFANAENAQQLASLTTTDAHGHAVIGPGHGDSITIPGMAPSYLQAHLQSLVPVH